MWDVVLAQGCMGTVQHAMNLFVIDGWCCCGKQTGKRKETGVEKVSRGLGVGVSGIKRLHGSGAGGLG